MPFIEKNHLKLHYEYTPATNANENTETIVLIHGLAFDLRSWDLIIPFLSDYHILAYDFRGHGLTDRGNEAASEVIYVEDLYFLLNRLNIKKAHLVAHGAGTLIALYFSRNYFSLVQSTVLLSIPVFHSQETAMKFAAYRKDYQTIDAIAQHVIPNVSRYPTGSVEIEKLFASYSKVSITLYFELMDFFKNHHDEFLDMFKRHTTPTLILTGEYDTFYPTYLSSLIASLNPICRYLTIPNSSNLIAYDQPEATFHQIEHFLKSICSANLPHAAAPPSYLTALHEDFTGIVNLNLPVRRHLLTVNLIETFEVYMDQESIASGWERRSAKEILIYLLFHPKVSRDQLCEDLWGHMEIRKARNQLRVCLSHLKQVLCQDEKQTLVIMNNSISLSDHLEVQSDLLALLAKINAASLESDCTAKRKIVHELFLQIDHHIFRNFLDDWSLHIRVKAEIQLIQLFHEQVEFLKSQDKYSEAHAYLQVIDLLAPEDEQITRT